jgi:hypothetical protein
MIHSRSALKMVGYLQGFSEYCCTVSKQEFIFTQLSEWRRTATERPEIKNTCKLSQKFQGDSLLSSCFNNCRKIQTFRIMNARFHRHNRKDNTFHEQPPGDVGSLFLMKLLTFTFRHCKILYTYNSN